MSPLRGFATTRNPQLPTRRSLLPTLHPPRATHHAPLATHPERWLPYHPPTCNEPPAWGSCASSCLSRIAPTTEEADEGTQISRTRTHRRRHRLRDQGSGAAQ